MNKKQILEQRKAREKRAAAIRKRQKEMIDQKAKIDENIIEMGKQIKEAFLNNQESVVVTIPNKIKFFPPGHFRISPTIAYNRVSFEPKICPKTATYEMRLFNEVFTPGMNIIHMKKSTKKNGGSEYHASS